MKLLSDLLYDARILEVRGTTHVAVEHIALDSESSAAWLVRRRARRHRGWARLHRHGHRIGATCVVCERMPEDTPDHVTVVQ